LYKGFVIYKISPNRQKKTKQLLQSQNGESRHGYCRQKNTQSSKLTVGPASKEVPESAIAAQPPAQNPDNDRCRI
jgi:hypothetical protein